MNHVEKKAITWFTNFWALSGFAGLAASLFIVNFLTNELNHYNIMSSLPNIVWQITCVITVLAGLTLLVKNGFFDKKEIALYNKCEKVLIIICWVVFTITAFDRLLLGFSTQWYLASHAENLKELNGITVATSLYTVIHATKTWVKGIQNTLALAFVGTFFGFILAMLLVFARTQKPNERDPKWLQVVKLIGNTFSGVYITVIRGTPMLVQALIIYYGGFDLMKIIFKEMSVSEIMKIYSLFTATSITVVLNTTAYITEILRGGIESLDKGQTEAARSLGMSAWQTMMKVVFPQAVKNSIPSICNEFIINVKDTAALNFLGMYEIMFAASTIAGTYYKYTEVYYVEAIIYLTLTLGLTALMNYIAKRLDMPTSHGLPSSN